MTITGSTLGPRISSATNSTEERSVWDYVPRVVQTFLFQPEGYRAWKSRGDWLQDSNDRRWNQLATIAAAAAIRAVRRAPRRRRLTSVDRGRSEIDMGTLDATDLAVVLFAAKVATRTDDITEDDIARLRSMGLTDSQVFDIALAAAASCFFADTAVTPAAS